MLGRRTAAGSVVPMDFGSFLVVQHEGRSWMQLPFTHDACRSLCGFFLGGKRLGMCSVVSLDVGIGGSRKASCGYRIFSVLAVWEVVLDDFVADLQ